MLKIFKVLPTLALGAGLLSMVSGSAQASVVFVFEGTSAGPMAGQTNYLYDLNFVTTIDSGTGQPNDRFVAGSTYGTLYDIVGFVSASVTPGSPFTFTTQPFGITPIGIAPTDTAATNVTVNYTGATTTTSTSFPLLLTVSSTATAINNQGQFSGQDIKNAGTSTGSPATNFGFVSVPGTSTPEPASMFTMAGGGLLLLIGAFRKKKA